MLGPRSLPGARRDAKDPAGGPVPLPSGRKERDARRAVLEAEVDSASSLSLPQLAAELMTKAFSATELRVVDGGYLGVRHSVARCTPDNSRCGEYPFPFFTELVCEGFQALGRASGVHA